MKILYIATSFPKKSKGSTIYTDLAEELVVKNHSVTVIVSEERKNTKKTSWENERGCKILRVRTGNIYDVGFVEKGISMLTLEYFLKGAIRKFLINEEFDLVLYESPPVTNCGIVKYVKNRFNAKTYLMLKDIFPQNAVDIGIMKKNSLVYKLFKKKEEALYSISDKIGCMSEGNKKYLLANSKLDKNKIEIFPNTKKIKTIDLEENNISIRDKYGINKDATIFLFGGNLGKPQGVDALCKVMLKLKGNKAIFFVIVGRGTERKVLKKFINDNSLDNVKQFDNLPRGEYERIVDESDVGLVILNSKFTIPNYPSRILSYMEYKKPVIAATDINTDFKELIEESKCGLWSSSDDIEAFTNNIIRIAQNEDIRNIMGKNGRNYMEKYLGVEKSVELIEKFMK